MFQRFSLLAGVSAIALLFTLIGCTTNTDPVTSEASREEASVVPILSTPPNDALPISELKRTAKKGDTVTFVARIGGKDPAFVEGRAMMVVIDPKIPSCADMGEEACCETPWDYCCEPRDSLKAGTVSVQITGDDGRPLTTDLKGKHGLNELVTVTIVGVVSEKNHDGLMVIDATGIHGQDG